MRYRRPPQPASKKSTQMICNYKCRLVFPAIPPPSSLPTTPKAKITRPSSTLFICPILMEGGFSFQYSLKCDDGQPERKSFFESGVTSILGRDFSLEKKESRLWQPPHRLRTFADCDQCVRMCIWKVRWTSAFGEEEKGSIIRLSSLVLFVPRHVNMQG